MSQLTPNQKAWVEALRSGKYQQGRGNLRRDGKFCCLGVACEVAMEHGIVLHRTDHPAYQEVHSGRLLPEVVGEFLGFKDNSGVTDWMFADKNDKGASFEEIATYVEQHAGELFVQESAA